MVDGEDEYSSDCLMDLESSISKTKRKRNRNKRRFSDEQIRSLEVMFESDTKLEPGKKARLARELGLQPRQIAIWFQNRRARWKSKQIEKDYTILLDSYNSLAVQFESLKRDNHSLSLQLEKLKKEKQAQSSSDGESKIDLELEVKNIASDEDSGIKAELLALDEESELLKMAADSSLTSSEDWGSLDSEDLINQPSQWWDFWS